MKNFEKARVAQVTWLTFQMLGRC